MVRGFAALSYKRAIDYVLAEQEYVGALRAAGSDWKSLYDNSVSDNLNNMMVRHRFNIYVAFQFLLSMCPTYNRISSHFVYRSFMKLRTELFSLV